MTASEALAWEGLHVKEETADMSTKDGMEFWLYRLEGSILYNKLGCQGNPGMGSALCN